MWSRGNYLLRRINVNKFCLTIGFVICFGLFGCSKDSDDLFSQCGIAEVGSESSSQKDANTAEISFLLLLKDVENSLFALSAHHHDVIISNSEEEFEKRLVEMNASRRQFEYSLARFSGFSCKSSDDYLNSKINEVAMLARDFLNIMDQMTEKRRYNFRLAQEAGRSKADFIVWQPVFRQMLQEMKLKVSDDYVDNLMLNLLTYQSLVEKKVLEALGSNNTDEIKKARATIAVFIEEYENWTDNLYSEMPEAKNEIGTVMTLFKYSCVDDSGVVGRHEYLVSNTNELIQDTTYAREKLHKIKHEITDTQMFVAKNLSDSRERAVTRYEYTVACTLTFFIFMLGVLIWRRQVKADKGRLCKTNKGNYN